MTNPDIFMMGLWLLSITVSLLMTIYCFIRKNKEGFKNSFFILFACITPFGIDNICFTMLLWWIGNKTITIITNDWE